MEIEFGRRHNNNTNSHLIRRSHRPLVVCTTTYQHLTHRRRDPRKKRKKKTEDQESLSLRFLIFSFFIFGLSLSFWYSLLFCSRVVDVKRSTQSKGAGAGADSNQKCKKQQKEKGRLGFFFHEPSGTTLGLKEGRGASDQWRKKSSSTCWVFIIWRTSPVGYI